MWKFSSFFFFLGFLGLEDFCIFIRETEIEDGGAA
ncbi:unknown [Bacteroides sp. CAG:530]|nr:unknown [Bacteroides sp. CAG:530]